MKSILILVMFLCISSAISAQNLIGYVYELDTHEGQQHQHPLLSANVFWKGTQIGATTDENGFFSLKKTGKDRSQLIVSYIGYKPDTIEVSKSLDSIVIVLSLNREFKEVLISADRSSKFIDEGEPQMIEVISNKELLKAACCNLGESFTTNASVDVQFQDAVTGARQIQLLGLAGTYTQMLFENIPSMNGIGSSFGLGFVPGPWISQISISKGSASVVNGYESITGQINIGYKKPTDAERYYFNAFQSSHLKTDLNANAAFEFSEHLSTMVLAHMNTTPKSFDDNGDSFADDPKTTQYNVMNRWKYHSDIGYEAELGFQLMSEKRNGGQMAPLSSGRKYSLDINSDHLDLFLKNGFVFNTEPYTSLGLILNGHRHTQNSQIGLRKYDARQTSFFGKLILETGTVDEIHKVTTGISFAYDEYKEELDNLALLRNESVPGVFLEYNYSPSNLISIVPGIRVDFHNLYGTFVTPRIHFKFMPDENTTLRASAGKGFRSVNLFSDNLNYFASSRSFDVINPPKFEEAWNYGLNLTRYFMINGRELSLTADYYRTDFIKQTVVDIDSDPRKVKFYDLNGTSYSNSYQIEAAYELLSDFNVSLAYRYTDVKSTYDGVLSTAPLQSRYKILSTVAWLIRDAGLTIDASFLLNGPGRIPSTAANPIQYQRSESFDPYLNINAQISKNFGFFDFYVGVENLTGYMQDNPIIAADDPFGTYFDASQIWGPVSGRKFYAGIRLSVL